MHQQRRRPSSSCYSMTELPPAAQSAALDATLEAKPPLDSKSHSQGYGLQRLASGLLPGASKHSSVGAGSGRYREAATTEGMETRSNVPPERIAYLWKVARATQTMVRITRCIEASRVHIDESEIKEEALQPKKMPQRTAHSKVTETRRRRRVDDRSQALVFPHKEWIINPDGKTVPECTVIGTIRILGVFFLVWAGMMLPCMAYASLVTPFETAFVTQDCALLLPNLVVDTYFTFDMIVNFNIAHFDWQRARWVTSRRLIAARYLRGWFTIDLLSCIPIDAVVASGGHPVKFIIILTSCGQSNGDELRLFSMLKLFRLLKLLRVLRIGRFVMRFAATVNVSFKTQTIVKFGVLILFVTHVYACLIRVLGESNDCRNNYDMNGDITCWLTSVKFFKRGNWYLYVASLDWAIKAMIGGSDSLTFGETILGFIIMISGLVLTSYLVGEIANVLGNFDPALNDFRSTMDNLNQYLRDQKINRPLQIQLREYFINSENLFRKAYHRSMLENLSPQLRRNVAQAELGNWVLSLPFLNDALRKCGGLEPGADILYVPLDKFLSENWTVKDMVPAQITQVNQSLTYGVKYYRLSAVNDDDIIKRNRASFADVAHTYSKANFDKRTLAVRLPSHDEKIQRSVSTSSQMARPLQCSQTKQSLFLDADIRWASKSFKLLQRELQRNRNWMNTELVEENGASHEQLFMPEFSLLRGRMADANREWKHLVAEFSLALTPKMFMMSEYIVRPGSLNTHLYMLMEGSGYVSDYTPAQVAKSKGSTWRGGVGKSSLCLDETVKSAWAFKRCLSAKNYDVVGTDIINTLVGAPMIVNYTATAVGHVFCNVLTSQNLNEIMTSDVYPKLTAEVRKFAGWQVLKLGVTRLGALAGQERRARFQYWQARQVLQRLYFRAHGIETQPEPVLPWGEDNVFSGRITSVTEACDVDDSESQSKEKVLNIGDHVEAEFRGKNYSLVRPAIVLGVHAKEWGSQPTSYMVRFTAKKQRILHTHRPDASVVVVDLDATMGRIERGENLDDGILLYYNHVSKLGTVYLKESTQIVEADRVKSCFKLNSRVRVRHFRNTLEGRICCFYTDGSYRIIYDYHDCRASAITWLFWRTDDTKRWLWCEADRVVVDIITSWRKMNRFDLEIAEDELFSRFSSPGIAPSRYLPRYSRLSLESHAGSERTILRPTAGIQRNLSPLTGTSGDLVAKMPKRRLSRERNTSELRRVEHQLEYRIRVLSERVDDIHNKLDRITNEACSIRSISRENCESTKVS